ncbi:hypothetical protein FHS39_002531 [Streptomyces olivoverticillatus]|uniref:4Fe-4S Wbl-type domain-containing protein n=1 Tax=Streptomyces olivoverticillatus TaxID=66427 RepID=A0A7W7LNI3_9ACTN|nr:WhiB family transcriptional regulator [Streptomyces olivoverticillatus]MBB4893500.1 hypothetical protein [Streptomyces olivoverticillatus]
MSAPAWEEKALCRERNVDFAPELAAKRYAARAKEVCRACPVTSPCLAAALAEERGLSSHFRDTVRGGLTPRERAALDRSQRQKENS